LLLLPPHQPCPAGGRAVLDTMEKALALSADKMEPSRAGLFRMGNVSSTSVWYVLAYIESFRGVKAGDRVWQLGFGSGFKVNSAVWVANKRIQVCVVGWAALAAVVSNTARTRFHASKQAYLTHCRFIILLQHLHPAWEGFDISKMHEVYDQLEVEKQQYLAAKARSTSTGGGSTVSFQ
jgi:hypothetical protein